MPIIDSWLDTDMYKWLMMQYTWKYHRRHSVTYSFTCRNEGIPLADYIDEGRLREELNHVMLLSLGHGECEYLRSLKTETGEQIFSNSFLYNARSMKRLPMYHLERVGDTYKLLFEGIWWETILWETPALAIITQLYFEGLRKKAGVTTGKIMEIGLDLLEHKIACLVCLPTELLSIIEFGTRRRYSRIWQDVVLGILLDEIPECIAGTSNLRLARHYEIPPRGTFAHELEMGTLGTEGDIYGDLDKVPDAIIKGAHPLVRQRWEELYPEMLIDLPDTYGSSWSLGNMTADELARWDGFRQDSGDPIAFGNELYQLYRRFGISPTEKKLLPSDGLRVSTIESLLSEFGKVFHLIFGWGSNLTADVALPNLSTVIKLVRSGSIRTVKLSDTPGKHLGLESDIERFKRIFGYDVVDEREVVY